MQYTIAAHETFYKGIRFRSRLEARWAAFFDLVGWEWKYEPIDFKGWTPDFWVAFPCGHSECTFRRAPHCNEPRCYCKDVDGEEAAKDAAIHARWWNQGHIGNYWDYDEAAEFRKTRRFDRDGPAHFDKNFRHELFVEVKPYFSIKEFDGHMVSALVDDYNGPPHPAMFGIDPSVVLWQMVHGAGGGYEDNLQNWTDCSIKEAWAKAGNITQWHPSAPLEHKIIRIK